MIHYRRAGYRTARVARSQLALRLGILLYAGLCTAIAMRCAVLVLSFPESVWTVQRILGLTDLVLRPVTFIPGATRVLIGNATLADLTIVLVLAAAPLALLSNPALHRADR